MRPPPNIDGADVVLWAWSEPAPFFEMPSSDGSSAIPIHGLAICRYPEDGAVYRFSCNSAWETENDSPYETVEAATRGESVQYDARSVQWHRWVSEPDPRAMPTLDADAESWVATVRRLEDGFFVKRDELPGQMGPQFSTRPVEGMPSSTQFFRVRVDLDDLPSSSGEIWVVCTAPATGNREPPPGSEPVDEARLGPVRSAVAAALPSATACFTTVDREGFSQVIGAAERAPAIAAAVAVAKYFAAWDESDPIDVTIADVRFAVSVSFSEKEYRALVRRERQYR